MRIGVIGLVVVILLVAGLLQNVYVGGLGGLLVLILIVMLLTGRL